MGRAKKTKQKTTVRAADGLTAKQTAFVREYRLDLNATQAAIRAGYSANTAAVIGHQNLRKLKIKAKLAESEAEALAKADLSAQHVLEVIRRHIMRDREAAYVGKRTGTFKPLHDLTPEQIQAHRHDRA